MTPIVASPVIILGKLSHLKAQLQVKTNTSTNVSLQIHQCFVQYTMQTPRIQQKGCWESHQRALYSLQKLQLSC